MEDQKVSGGGFSSPNCFGAGNSPPAQGPIDGPDNVDNVQPAVNEEVVEEEPQEKPEKGKKASS